MFWIAIVLLCGAALGFCWPLLRAGVSGQVVAAQGESSAEALARREAYNAALYKEYEAELLADSAIDDAARAGLLADKGRQLLDDTRHLTEAHSSARQPDGQQGVGTGLKLLALLLLLGGSAFTYLQLGTPQAQTLLDAREILALPAVGEKADAEGAAGVAKLRLLTASVRGHVADSADDAGSWYLLGIGELKLGAYAEAADAFAVAHGLVGEDANLDLYWLQARLLADEGKLSPATREIASRVLASQPNQPTVLNMLALAAFRSQDFGTAVSYLNRALSSELPKGRRTALDVGLTQARQALGVAGPTVDVGLNLAAGVPAGAVLFVIARPVGGGMPYAVVRRPANAAPAQVRLDDAVSMNPANPLSAATEVEILARVSLSGRPQAGPGDWQWRSEPLKPADWANRETPLRLEARLGPPKQAGTAK